MLNNEKISFWSSFTIIMLLTLLCGAFVCLRANTKELNSIRNLADEYRIAYVSAARENSRVRDCLRSCRDIIGELGDTTEQSIGNLSEAIDYVEQIRYQVAILANTLCSFDTSDVFTGNDLQPYFDWEYNKITNIHSAGE